MQQLSRHELIAKIDSLSNYHANLLERENEMCIACSFKNTNECACRQWKDSIDTRINLIKEIAKLKEQYRRIKL